MVEIVGLRCIRCGAAYAVDYFAHDCDACRAEAPSNLVVDYGDRLRVPRPKPQPDAPRGLWRDGDVLSVPAAAAVTLGEGSTPLHRLERMGAAIGVKQLYAKDETRNPTWSFKDRLAALAVSKARQIGAQAIVSSSSGNAGAAAAAYAARAGIPCYVFVVRGSAGPMVTQMRAYGATVVEVATKADRWTPMHHAVRTYGWFPTSPFFGPVGSNPFGIDGYKTLAYEIAEALDWQVPDVCVLPVCYGDALIGMWRGFEDMIAFGWTGRNAANDCGRDLRFAHHRIDGRQRPSPGHAQDVRHGFRIDQRNARHIPGASHRSHVRRHGHHCARRRHDALAGLLARKEGLYVEPASATAVAGVELLVKRGAIRPDDTVVALLTASGLKDPDRTTAIFGAPSWGAERAGGRHCCAPGRRRISSLKADRWKASRSTVTSQNVPAFNAAA